MAVLQKPHSTVFCFQAVKACGMESWPLAFPGRGRNLEGSCQHFYTRLCEKPGQLKKCFAVLLPVITDLHTQVTDTGLCCPTRHVEKQLFLLHNPGQKRRNALSHPLPV